MFSAAIFIQHVVKTSKHTFTCEKSAVFRYSVISCGDIAGVVSITVGSGPTNTQHNICFIKGKPTFCEKKMTWGTALFSSKIAYASSKDSYQHVLLLEKMT